MRPVDALLEILRSEGVTKVFGNPGTTELPFVDALAAAPDIEYVLGLHEGSVVAMADGYARATQRPAFVSLHVAAGVANGLLGMLDASRSRTPLVVTAGQQDRRHLAQDPMLSGDLVGLATAASKSAIEVQHAYDLPTVLRRAFAHAAQPPAGPMFVSIPMDLLDEDSVVAVPPPTWVPAPGHSDGLDAAAGVLAAAEHPVVVAGDGVGRASAVAELVAVAERLGATVHHQPMYDGVDFPCTHPLYAGMLPPRNAAIRETLAAYDVLLLVGAHAFTPHHYTPGPPVPEGMTVVQLDADPAEIGRNFPATTAVTGDVRGSLRALADRLDGRVPYARRRIDAALAANEQRRNAIDGRARAAYGDAPVDSLAAAHAVANGLPDGAIVVEEAITVGVHLREVYRPDEPGTYVHTVGGALGWGIGAAVGTSMARPDRPVVAVLGDGCAMFGLQGLWSAARYGVPVLFVVMDNGEYRTLKDTLDERDSRSTSLRRYVGLDLAPPRLDWAGAAQLFGIPYAGVGSADELRTLVAKAGGLDGPLLVSVPIRGHLPR